jgi:hypothetical protein
MRRCRALALVLALVAGVATGRAAAQPVDLLLVLCVDASGSIDPEEFRLQREGYAAAIADPRVVRAMTDGPRRAIGLAFVEWGTPGEARTVLAWSRVHDAASAQDFAARMLAAPRTPQSYNAIGDAIAHAHGLIRASPFASERAVIDVSGDGPDNRSFVPAPMARDEAVRAGVTINALVILKEGSSTASRGEALVDAYTRDVIGGPGAFVITARDYPDFARAIYNKLIREVAEAMAREPRYSGARRVGVATARGGNTEVWP